MFPHAVKKLGQPLDVPHTHAQIKVPYYGTLYDGSEGVVSCHCKHGLLWAVHEISCSQTMLCSWLHRLMQHKHARAGESALLRNIHRVRSREDRGRRRGTVQGAEDGPHHCGHVGSPQTGGCPARGDATGILKPHLLFAQNITPVFSHTGAVRRPMVKRSTVWRILMSRGITNLPSDAVSPLKTGANEIEFSR